jgi:hypothetical protein
MIALRLVLLPYVDVGIIEAPLDELFTRLKPALMANDGCRPKMTAVETIPFYRASLRDVPRDHG